MQLETMVKKGVDKWWAVNNADAHKEAREKRWLDEQIKRGRHERFAVVKEITPELASLILANNPANRNASPELAAKWARDIMAGRFPFNGESIILADTAELNDGQTRLTACLMANRPITSVIVFGAPRETRTTIDGGRARTTGHYLGMLGETNPNNIAAMASTIITITAHGRLVTDHTLTPTKQEILEFGRENSEQLHECFNVAQKKGAAKLCARSLLAASYWFISRRNASLVDEFFGRLIDGDGLKAKDPRFIARNKLMDKRLRLTSNEKLKTIYAAWNKWRSGRTAQQLPHTMLRGERLPELCK